MKTIPLFQVDAFSDQVFRGNPAAICPLNEWLPDDLMQQIAMENNLAETAFYVQQTDHVEIRWFTPTVEVDLCGHATLAAAHVLFSIYKVAGDMIRFYSHRSGELLVFREGDWLTLDFPADPAKQVIPSEQLLACFPKAPVEVYKGKTDYMLVYDQRSDIETLQPDMLRLAQLTECRGVIVTAPGEDEDFVSRFFAPQSGIAEDPVTGSAHTTLTPYWSARLGKQELKAAQLSPRGGILRCADHGQRIRISGQASLFMKGEILL